MKSGHVVEQELDPQVQPTMGKSSPVLCVDLDGTLLASNSFLESTILLIHQKPWLLFLFPLWIMYGKAYFKRQVACRVTLDVNHLPFRKEVLSFLREEFDKGRELVLITGTDRKIAEPIANHLGIFSQVLASRRINLSAYHKRRALEARFGLGGYDYIGNRSDDLQVWASANTAFVVGRPKNLLREIKRRAPIQTLFPKSSVSFPLLLKTLRVHQWIKNILIFLPLVTAHLIFTWPYMINASFAFLAFSLCASGLYLFNDVLDLPADRRHPKKKHRPLASGTFPLEIALPLQPLLILGGFSLAWVTLPRSFVGLLLLYSFTTVGYSLYLKKLIMLDVLTLAGLYALRVLAGGVAVGIPISAWLLAFSLFFFLSLAFGKRHAELQFRKVTKYQGVERRAYLGGDKESLGTMGMISGYVAVLVLALYINSQEVLALYTKPQFLWLTCPALLYWISRTWLLAHRGGSDDDPLIIALRDPRTYIVALAMGLCGLLAV